MRLITSLSLIAVAVPLSLAALIGSTSIISVAYAKSSKTNSRQSTHGSGYQPPIDEQKMNCKQISGRVQIMILQLRGYGDRKQASGFSRGLQSAFVGTVGTTAIGVDPDGAHAADLKKLQDYNQKLAGLGCKSYDLNYELQQTDPHETPAARVPAPKKAKAAASHSQKQN
jgi:hypothetical protein